MSEPFLPMAVPVLGETEMKYLTDALASGWVAQGKYVTDFEGAFAKFCGAAHGVAVSNGSTALHVAVAALGIGPGDEVIVPALTHIAAANAVTLAGATVVAADCDARTWNLDLDSVRERITPRTKAVIAVHLYGHPVDMDPLMQMAAKHGFKVIEDAAEAHGAEYKGRRCGSLGHLATFSFYANKMITTGEGGMVTTNDDQIADRLRKLRDQAYEKDHRFMHRELGFNYRLTNLQAALGLAQLQSIDKFIAHRRSNARLYNELFADVPGIVTPPSEPWANTVYWVYAALIDEAFGESVPEVMKALKQQNIDSRPFFYPLHLQPLYAEKLRSYPCPKAERSYNRGINLPLGNELTEESVRRVASAVARISQRASVR